MGLSDSPSGPLAVMSFRQPSLRVPTPLPHRVSQVPRLFCPCALPPLTPGRPATACAHCFVAGLRLHPIGRTGHFRRVTRPKRVRLRCGSQVRLSRLRQTDCSASRSIGYVSNGQFTRWVPFTSLDQPGLSWRTRWTRMNAD